jgi:hypothetical protein
VWEDGGEILGWAMSDDGDVIDVVAPRLLDSPLDEEFRRAVEAWIRSEQPEALRYASNLDVRGCARLEASGYRATGDAIVAFRRRLDALEQPKARVRALVTGDDVRGRASITHAAFDVERPLSVMPRSTRRSPGRPRTRAAGTSSRRTTRAMPPRVVSRGRTRSAGPATSSRSRRIRGSHGKASRAR